MDGDAGDAAEDAVDGVGDEVAAGFALVAEEEAEDHGEDAKAGEAEGGHATGGFLAGVGFFGVANASCGELFEGGRRSDVFGLRDGGWGVRQRNGGDGGGFGGRSGGGDGVVEVEDGLDVAEADAVAIGEEGFFNGGTVDAGAVAGVEILDVPACFRGSELSVMGGDGAALQEKRIVLVAADRARLFGIENMSGGRAVFEKENQ